MTRREGTALTAVIVGSLVGLALLIEPAARLDFYFDEMWRVEQIRSPNPVSAYLAGPAPIPPGWIVALWTMFEVVPDRRFLFRVAAASAAIPAVVLLTFTFRRLLGSAAPRVDALLVGGLVSTLTLLAPASAAHAVYFNNYLTDIAVAAAIVGVLVALDLDPRNRRTWIWVFVIAALAPWFAQSALLLAPVGAVIVARHRNHQPIWARASGAAFALSATTTALLFLLPVARNGTIEDFWKSETPAVGVAELARRTASTFVDAAYPPWVGDHPVWLACGLALTAVGLVLLQRAWVWWMPLYVSAQVFALLAALTVGWPATFVRVNSGFQLLVYAGAPFALGTGVLMVVRTARVPPSSSLAARTGAGLMALAAVFAWWPHDIVANSSSTGVFARGLGDDLRLVANEVRPGDVVAAYHLTGPYVRNSLIDGPSAVSIIDEAREPSMAFDLGSMIPATTDTAWCVVPYEAGPAAFEQACRLEPAGWEETLRSALPRATIIRMERRQDT